MVKIKPQDSSSSPPTKKLFLIGSSSSILNSLTSFEASVIFDDTTMIFAVRRIEEYAPAK